MDPYIFALSDNQHEVYREEVLAASDEDAIELAIDALNGLRHHYAWTLASLSDFAGRVVWSVARGYPRAPGH